MRSAHVWGSAIGLFLAVSCANDPTEIVLAIDSDLEIPTTLGRVEIVAWSNRAEPLRTAIDLTSGSDLPRTLVLFPSVGDSGRFSASVIGLPEPGFRVVLVRRDLDVSFVPEETRLLSVSLSNDCLSTWSTCADGETCDRGVCRPIAVEPDELAPWDGSVPPRSSECVPRDETCNDRDDDCDGERDDGFDHANDAAHCGVCGRVCESGACADGYCPGALPVAISAGSAHTCVLRQSGVVSCFGWNGAGQIGSDSTGGDSLDAERPLDVPSLTAGAISAGGAHTCAVATDGRVLCWGDNSHGELGDSSGRASQAPVEVVDLRASSISAGLDHTCAVQSAGTVACWGDNAYGELGRSPSAGSGAPLEVPGLSGVERISVGANHSCALVSGRAYCWGDDSEGQLGDGLTTSRATPMPVSGDASDLVELAAGRRHTCALRSSGAVLCWGRNLEGQLGDGTRERRLLPTQIVLPAGATRLVSGPGSHHTCALLENGEIACWGANGSGQLGDGTTDDRPIAATIAGLGRVVALTTGGDAQGGGHTCAVDRTGAVYCWGRGDTSRTGTFYPLDTSQPAPVEELPYRHLPDFAP